MPEPENSDRNGEINLYFSGCLDGFSAGAISGFDNELSKSDKSLVCRWLMPIAAWPIAGPPLEGFVKACA
jgi:hypothetical protein